MPAEHALHDSSARRRRRAGRRRTSQFRRRKFCARASALRASSQSRRTRPTRRSSHDMERDFWMNAKEAIEYGIVSRVVESHRQLV